MFPFVFAVKGMALTEFVFQWCYFVICYQCIGKITVCFELETMVNKVTYMQSKFIVFHMEQTNVIPIKFVVIK